ncbi:hypothetical protein AB0L00_10855 [Actinoallomurus sp. NPDC052308]|uniref:hypothetical protein n=1 Tax=Actinoallomurus sp. NPDC052308 TaxID=3155530 RepID=UPI003445963B
MPTEEERSAGAEYEKELADITRGDIARTEIMRAALRQLARGSGGPVLQEMAREVLAGRLKLRDAVKTEAYGQALFGDYQEFWQKIEQRPVAERKRLAASSEQMLARLRAKLEAENGNS